MARTERGPGGIDFGVCIEAAGVYTTAGAPDPALQRPTMYFGIHQTGRVQSLDDFSAVGESNFLENLLDTFTAGYWTGWHLLPVSAVGILVVLLWQRRSRRRRNRTP